MHLCLNSPLDTQNIIKTEPRRPRHSANYCVKVYKCPVFQVRINYRIQMYAICNGSMQLLWNYPSSTGHLEWLSLPSVVVGLVSTFPLSVKTQLQRRTIVQIDDVLLEELDVTQAKPMLDSSSHAQYGNGHIIFFYVSLCAAIEFVYVWLHGMWFFKARAFGSQNRGC